MLDVKKIILKTRDLAVELHKWIRLSGSLLRKS